MVVSRAAYKSVSAWGQAYSRECISFMMPPPGQDRARPVDGRRGSVPEWLGSGLQNRVRRFDSARSLHTPSILNIVKSADCGWFLLPCMKRWADIPENARLFEKIWLPCLAAPVALG